MELGDLSKVYILILVTILFMVSFVAWVSPALRRLLARLRK